MIGRLITFGLLVAGALASATCAFVDSAWAASPPRPGNIGIRLVEAPVSLRDDPRAQHYIIDHLSPGEDISRRIEVSNTSDSTMQVSIYSAAAMINDGAFRFSTGRAQNELSTWTTFSRHRLSLAPGGRSTFTATITVPDDASKGERYAVIWAETSSSGPPGGVTQLGRAGVRAYVFVGRGGAPPSDFTIDTLTAQRSAGGQPTVLARVHNTGGRALDLSGSLELTEGPGGLRAGPFPVRLGTTLAPDDFGPVSVTLDGRLPDGPWVARIRLESGLTVRTATATIRFPKGVGSAAAVVAKEESGLHPVIIIGLAVLALALIVIIGALVLSRRRRRIRGEEDSQPHPWTPPDALVGDGHHRVP